MAPLSKGDTDSRGPAQTGANAIRVSMNLYGNYVALQDVLNDLQFIDFAEFYSEELGRVHAVTKDTIARDTLVAKGSTY